jgi:hypothetical protein
VQRNARGREADRPPGVGDLPRDVRELLPDDVVDELLAGARGEEEVVGPGGLLSQLTKRLVERAMEVELTEHLGYEPHLEPPGGAGNGSTPGTLITEHGPVRIDTPRQLRASDRSQASAAVRGVRREDPRPLLEGAFDAGYRSAPRRDRSVVVRVHSGAPESSDSNPGPQKGRWVQRPREPIRVRVGAAPPACLGPCVAARLPRWHRAHDRLGLYESPRRA